MNTKEAKDFFVQQASEQAAFEGVSLSELEKGMMYFTESDASSCGDPIELNDQFEAQYDTPEYEAKMSALLHHAYSRLRKENLEILGRWAEAMAVLKRGDHYLLVLWRVRPRSEHPTRDLLAHLGIGVLIAVVIFIGIMIFVIFGSK